MLERHLTLTGLRSGTPTGHLMNPNYRNLALWAIIAVLLIALFNLFQTPQQRGASREIAYSEFLQDLSGGRVKTVTIAGDRITGTYIDNASGFQTYSPGDPDAGAAARRQGRDDQRAARDRRLELDLRLPDLVAADGADPRRLDLLHAPDAVRLRPRHGLRQVQGQAADRGAWPRHLRGRRRRRRGQGRPRGDRRVPARPAEVPAAGRQDPARRAAGRPSRHRQDAACARRRRRSQRAVLHHLRLGLRRNVRRRRRQPRARHVRPGQEERALHHLHRRNRRGRPPSRRRPRRRQRRARADAEPAAGRDGRLRGQ